jgi:endonuclease YncB( thermonuclease family)
MVRGVAKVLGLAGAVWLAASCVAARACDVTASEVASVAGVIDGETLKLTDGRIVRLVGAKAPMPPLGWRGEDPWPFVEDAKRALKGLASGRQVELGFVGRRNDRHDHLLAQVFLDRGGERLWVQREMVARGLARVYSFADSRACALELLPIESEARAKRRGIWGSSAYRVVDALDLERLGRLIHSYQLVEGKVVSVGAGSGRLYLNFSQDWRRDFTVSVERKVLAAFAASGLELESMAGRNLRVRGTLAWRNGPLIEANHPEQIELLPEPQPAGL